MSERLCRKCNNKIPATVRIDGVRKNLKNRKFCLECSPWGKHNTSAVDPIRRMNKQNTAYADWPEKWRETLRQSNYRRIRDRKIKLVEMSGGKCEMCGYNKCFNALAFHHKYDKKFLLSGTNLASNSWESILNERAKCKLLCMNCHTELHSQ